MPPRTEWEGKRPALTSSDAGMRAAAWGGERGGGEEAAKEEGEEGGQGDGTGTVEEEEAKEEGEGNEPATLPLIPVPA